MITTRLQLASRIQLLLFRELGEKIDIERMLADPRYADDVLALCDSVRSEEAGRLARRYREATSAGRALHHRLPMGSGDATGFGVTEPMDDELPALPRSSREGGWLAVTRRWLRR